MKIEQRLHANIAILRPVGRIDSLNSAEFQTRLLAAVASGVRDCIIDVSAVEFISSAGLRAIVSGVRAKPRGAQLAIAAANAVVGEILKVSRFSHVLPIFATVGEAAAALLAPPPPAAAPQPPARQPASDAPASLAVRFWGTRGALPAPLRESELRAKIRAAVAAAIAHAPASAHEIDAFIETVLPFSVRGTYGGDSSCVEIATDGEDAVLCDLGTGVREFGRRELAGHVAGRKRCYHVFQSHLHWDHVMGLPFFAPAFVPGNLIRIYGCHDGLEEAFRSRQAPPHFPIDFAAFQAEIEFVALAPGRTAEIAGLCVTAQQQPHAGDSYGYRFSRAGKTIVYSTDCEHKYLQLDNSYPFIDFFRDADVLIFDAMHSPADTVSIKEDRGHSSSLVGVELAQMARVKRLVLFHHDPACDDAMIDRILAEAVRLEEIGRRSHRVEVIAAYDGLELTV